jgi:hypothetical protein
MIIIKEISGFSSIHPSAWGNIRAFVSIRVYFGHSEVERQRMQHYNWEYALE